MVTDDAELQQLVSDWYGLGILSDANKARLRARYLSDLGASTCTTCPDWLRDMQTHFRIYLKSQNLFIMSPVQNEYMVAESIGSFYYFGTGTLITNGVGDPSPGVTFLTDELAHGILKASPELKEHVIKNPEYVAPDAKKKGDDAKVEPAKEAAKEGAAK